MTYQKHDRPKPSTTTDYAIGHHQGWEVDAHVAEEEFKKKTGHQWTWDQRRAWLGRYHAFTSYATVYTVRPCPVCVEHIENAFLKGQDPFKEPEACKEERHKLNRKISSVLGVRKRHIDSV